MKSASRTVGAIGDGAIGRLVAVPVGAVAGGVSLDGVTAGVDSAIHGEF